MELIMRLHSLQRLKKYFRSSGNVLELGVTSVRSPGRIDRELSVGGWRTAIREIGFGERGDYEHYRQRLRIWWVAILNKADDGACKQPQFWLGLVAKPTRPK